MRRNGYQLHRRIKALEGQIPADAGSGETDWIDALSDEELEPLVAGERRALCEAGLLELTASGYVVPEGITEDLEELQEIAMYGNQDLRHRARARIPYPPRGSIFEVNGFSIMEEGTSGRDLVMTAHLDKGPDGRFVVLAGADNADLLAQLAEILNSELP